MSNNSEIHFIETPFDILGLSIDASDEQILKNFHRLTLIYHPDHNASQNAHEKYIHIKNAFDQLKDINTRQEIIRDINEGVYRERSNDDIDVDDIVEEYENNTDLEEKLKAYVSEYMGHPTISAFPDLGYHFSFGLRKAEWIIKNINLIKKFVEIYGD